MFEISYRQIIEGMNRRDMMKEEVKATKGKNDSIYEPEEMDAPAEEYKTLNPTLFDVQNCDQPLRSENRT